MPRIFLAIEVPPVVRQLVSSHIESIRRQIPQAPVAWVPPDNHHLTLKFLGQAEPEQVPSIIEAAERAAVEREQFEIKLAQTGCFPPRGAPRVLWTGVEDPDQHLTLLHAKIETELARVGFGLDEKPFHPHLTIGRVRRPAGAGEIGRLHRQTEFGPAPVKVESLTVFESKLSSAGARHLVLSRHPLRT